MLEKENYTNNMLKTFLDLVVLSMLTYEPLHGYKIIANIHKKFGVLISPGTLYPLLYNLQEKGLLNVRSAKRKKIYRITSKGQENLTRILGVSKINSQIIFKFIDENCTQQNLIT